MVYMGLYVQSSKSNGHRETGTIWFKLFVLSDLADESDSSITSSACNAELSARLSSLAFLTASTQS